MALKQEFEESNKNKLAGKDDITKALQREKVRFARLKSIAKTFWNDQDTKKLFFDHFAKHPKRELYST